jgi:hypothetical protein
MLGIFAGTRRADSSGVKILASGVAALLLFAGASGTTGPLKDSLGSLLSWRDEMSRARTEIADLRHGRGATAPAWVNEYAKAICQHDAEFVASHTDQSLGMTLDEVKAQFDNMHAHGLDCTSVRYLGAVDRNEFVYALRQGPKEIWYVFTISPDGASVVRVD